ncbi:MAG TPA: trypsin-like peptidase domain-containing protein [Blastocatellia bacterium]|nr:trypsin-like peptidase domain-containing protein [Blastocatellia bacterium]
METQDTHESNALPAFSDGLAGAVERAGGAIVAINARQRIPSSGILWREGVIAAADHTIKREEEITVLLPDGRTVPATLAGRDPGTDLAVLKFDSAGLGPAEIGDTASLKVGHLVLAVGRVSEHGPSASLGVVSATGGAWRTWRGGMLDQFVRLDLAIYDGFSGGPLVDLQGRVVGLNTSGLTRGGALTIPTATVNRVVDEILARGHVRRAWLGVGMQPVQLPEALRQRLNLTNEYGVIVLSVEPDGPADKSGMLVGDVLVALGGAPVSDTDEVQAALGPERVGQPLDAGLIRGGALVQLTITVGERPQGRRRQ